jgi:hypothetical protein
MTIYHPKPVTWLKLWPRYAVLLILVTVGTTVGIPLLMSLFADLRPGNMSGVLQRVILFAIGSSIISAVLSAVTAKQANQYQLLISDEAVISRKPNRPDWIIRFDEIDEIIENSSGAIIVKAAKPERAIMVVPKMMVDGEVIRARLSDIQPIKPAPITSLFGRLGTVLTILMFFCIPLSFFPIPWIALPSAIILAAFAGRGLWAFLQPSPIPFRAKLLNIALQAFLLIWALIAAVRIILVLI